MRTIRIATTFPLQAFDINDQFSADGFILGAGQCQNVSALLPGETYGGVLDDTVDPPLVDDSMDKFGNEYANDSATQFMNEVFENSANHRFPSYDAGAALELAHRGWTFNAVGMNIGENDDGENFNFWGAEVGYHPETSFGAGNYRLIVAGTSTAFLDPTETDKEKRLALGLSFDQAFGDVVGGFLRIAWQSDDAAVDYKALYSGGLNFSGNGWGRESDNIGVGYAYLPGGNLDVENSHVFEAYYRAGLNEYVSLSADIQYMKDDLIEVDPRQDNPSGWIFGLRLTASF